MALTSQEVLVRRKWLKYAVWSHCFLFKTHSLFPVKEYISSTFGSEKRRMVIATTLLPAITLCFILVPQGQHKASYKVLLLKELWNCFLKRKKNSGSVVVDDAYHSTKLCGLQSKRFALPADQYPGPALVWLPLYPTCGSVVVYEAQRSVSHNQNYKFNCSPFQNLPPLVPLHHVTWVMSTFFFFF